METLEDRQLLACGICTFSAATGRLFVDTPVGNNDDGVAIGALPVGGETYVVVTFTPEGGSPSTDRVETSPGSSVYVRPGDVRAIDVETHDGKDEIDLRNVTTANGYIGSLLDGHIELKGQERSDTIYGSEFNDVLIGGDRDDALEGGLGDDLYRFIPVVSDKGLGDDKILDTGGIDTLDYSGIDFPIDVDLSITDTFQTVGPNHRLKFVGATIENVDASLVSAFPDTLIGNALDNRLDGHGGDDHLVGNDGNDILWGRDGADRANGGPGADVVYGGVDDDIVEGDGFGPRVEDGALEGPDPADPRFDPLNEASGLVVGRVNPGILWTIEDRGNPTYLYANTTDGASRGFYNVTNEQVGGPTAANIDWEDLAFYEDNGTRYLYIADIGDGTDSRFRVTIYRVEEPAVDGTADTFRGSLRFAAVHLAYPADGDGGRDAETFMVDPLTGDFYIVSKAEPSRAAAHLYRTPKPVVTAWSTDPATAATLTLTDEGSTGFLANAGNFSPSRADISPDGREVALGSDAELHLYKFDQDAPVRSLSSLLTANTPLQVFREREKENRESIAFSTDAVSLYTVAEADVDKDTGAVLPRSVNIFNRVTDLLGPAHENRDALFGGDPATLSAGTDFYIGVLDTVDTTRNEVMDFRGAGANDVDLLLDLAGDMDFDGLVNGLDVAPFTMATLSSVQYLATWGLGGYVHGDMNGDGEVNGLDVQPFVEAVLGSGVASTAADTGDGSSSANPAVPVAAGIPSTEAPVDPANLIPSRSGVGARTVPAKHTGQSMRLARREGLPATDQQRLVADHFNRLGRATRHTGPQRAGRIAAKKNARDVSHLIRGRWHRLVDHALAADTGWLDKSLPGIVVGHDLWL